jgi:hypothetical protein
MKTRHNHGLRKGYRVQYKNKAGEVKNGTILKVSSYSFTTRGIKTTYTSFVFGENGRVLVSKGESISCEQGQEMTIVLGPATV